MSKFTFVLVSGLLIGSLSAALPAAAQSVNGSNGDSRDPFSRAAAGDQGGLMQLLHGVQNGAIRNDTEFNVQQQRQISGSTEGFRAEQLRRLRAQQQAKKPAQ
jgi:hypothetical protein